MAEATAVSLCELTTPRAQEWLAGSRQARILHLFAATCNLVNEQGEVLSLVSRRIGAGPFSLVLGEPRAWPAEASARVRIDRRAQRLSVGPLVVGYGSARCWQPRPDWDRLRGCLDPTALQRQGLPPPSPAISPEIAALLHRLVDGICGEKRGLAREAALRLAGRGEGLTPTGDDVLLGVLYALCVWKADGGWQTQIVDAAAARTTTLSAAFLRAAAAGEATAPWHRLVAGDPAAVAAILATGHRSGAESWAAFVTAGARLCGVIG